MIDNFGAYKTKLWQDCYRHTAHDGRVHSNNEEQYYAVAPANHEIVKGVLRLRADKHETLMGYPYTSGMIASWDKFAQLYGRFEIRCKMPKGQGLWPAFWLLPHTIPQTWPPEIDIVEFLGHEPNTVHFNSHYRDKNGKNKSTGSFPFTGPDFTQDFHIFAVEWTPDLLVWYVDGIERARTDAEVPNEPMFMLANLAVGGNWPGSPDKTTIFPSYFEIDYIQVYENIETRSVFLGYRRNKGVRVRSSCTLRNTLKKAKRIKHSEVTNG